MDIRYNIFLEIIKTAVKLNKVVGHHFFIKLFRHNYDGLARIKGYT